MPESSPEGEAGPAGGTEADARPRSPRWRLAARLALGALLVVIVVVYRRYLAQSFRALGGLDWTWFALAVVAETVSILAFAFSRRRLLLASGRQPRRRAMIAITYASNAMSLSLPFAGTGLATVYSYRQFRRRGVDAATTGWALAVSGIFSTTSLALLLVAGAIAGGQPFAVLAGLSGAAVYLVPGTAVLLAVRYDRARKLFGRMLIGAVHAARRLPMRRMAGGADGATWLADFPARLEGFLDRIASISLPRRGYAGVFGLATANWLADCAALGLAVLATGQPVPWHGLLLAYCTGAAVGGTGLTPGGFGLVELALAAALTAGGLATSGALAAVIAYRLVSFWLVILAGWLLVPLLGDRPGTEASAP